MNTSIATKERRNKLQVTTRVRNALLVCGILSSVLYVFMNIVVPFYFPGYSVVSQTVSELSAINAPSRPIWVILGIIYSLLVCLFGWGVWQAAYKSKPLNVLAVLILIYGFSGFFWPPMHLRGNQSSLTDILHIVFGIATVILMMFMMWFGAKAFGKKFRLYCFVSLALFILFGTLTGIESPNIATNEPTPLIGVWERINIGIFLLWIIVFAITLLQKRACITSSND